MGSKPPRWRRALPVLILWILALGAYSNSFRAGMVVDNASVILKDERVHAWTSRNIELIFKLDYWNRRTTSALYRPLTNLSYLFNYAVLGNGPRPAGYHWINLALHAVNILLVYLLGLLLFREFGPAFALAALWGVHPVLTESVTNIVGRADMLAGFGVLAGLLCHVRAASAAGLRKTVWIVALALAATAGMFSKESGVVVLAAMGIYDVAYRSQASWRGRLPSYLAVGISLALYLYARGRVLAVVPESLPTFSDNPLGGAGFWTSRLTAVKVFGRYFRLLLWPDRLSCDYSYNQVPLFGWSLANWEDWQVPLALAGCLVALWIAARCYRRQKPVFFFILFAFAALAPMANVLVIIGTIMAERFLYLSAIGFVGCLVAAVYAAGRRLPARWPGSQRAVAVALALVALAFAGRTWARNLDWTGEPNLWSSAAEAAPGSYKAHISLASAWLTEKQTDPDRAIRECDRAIAILDQLPDHLNWGRPYAVAGEWYRRRGDVASAGERAEWYRKGVEILLRGRRVDRAMAREIEEGNAARGKTFFAGWPPLYLELGRTYLRLGETMKAIEALDFSRRLEQNPEVIQELARAYNAAGNGEQAAITAMEGLILDPSQAGFATDLVEFYRKIDPGGCSVAIASGSVSIDPTCPRVHEHICVASRNVAQTYLKIRQVSRAAEVAARAVQALGCPAAMFR